MSNCTKCIFEYDLLKDTVETATWTAGAKDFEIPNSGADLASTIRTGMVVNDDTSGDDYSDFIFYNNGYGIRTKGQSAHFLRFKQDGAGQDLNITRYYFDNSLPLQVIPPKLTWPQTPTFTSIQGKNLGILRSMMPTLIDFTVINDDELHSTALYEIREAIEEGKFIGLRFPEYRIEGYINQDLSRSIFNPDTEIFHSFQVVITNFAYKQDVSINTGGGAVGYLDLLRYNF